MKTQVLELSAVSVNCHIWAHGDIYNEYISFGTSQKYTCTCNYSVF